jgi:hypothetical protein
LLITAIGVPPPIDSLSVANAGDGHTIYLSWQPLLDNNIIGYHVYQGNSPGGLGVVDTVVVPADTIRGAIEGSRIYFAVTGVASNGTESMIENVDSFTPQSRPTRPDTLTISPDLGQLRIRWTASPDFDLDHYQLWRRVGSDSSFTPYIQVRGQSEYIDQNLQSNVRYYYYVTAVDTTNISSEPSHTDYSKVLSFDSGILLVDEFLDGTGGQGQPTGAQQDSFFAYISANYHTDMYDIQNQGVIRINDLGPYSTVVYFDEDPTYHLLPTVQGDLVQYLAHGGNLFFTGWRTFYAYSIARPLIFHQGDFPYDYLKISSAYSTTTPDFTGASGLSGWPDLHNLPERVIQPWNGRLLGVDVFTFQDSVNVLYTYNSSQGDTALQGHPVGFAVQGMPYNCVYFSFPLYALGNDAARDIFGRVMTRFDEETAISPEENNPILSTFLVQNFPNPFNAETKISFSLNHSSKIRLDVFNILGQQVALLADKYLPAGNHSVIWNADKMPSGIYFYRLLTDAGSFSRRMILLK